MRLASRNHKSGQPAASRRARGGSLAGGWTTERDCVACPYHGWEFDGEGETQFIPSLGENADIPEKARIDAYPTEERYGMVWVFLGDLAEEKRYPIPPFPEGALPVARIAEFALLSRGQPSILCT